MHWIQSPSFPVTFLAYFCIMGPNMWQFLAPTLTRHFHTISLKSLFAVLLCSPFPFPLAQFSHHFKISIIFFRIPFNPVLPMLNIFMTCLTDNLSRSLAWITLTLVLEPLLSKNSVRGKQFRHIFSIGEAVPLKAELKGIKKTKFCRMYRMTKILLSYAFWRLEIFCINVQTSVSAFNPCY
jgi:hypothetical protein